MAPLPPATVEQYYARGIYPWLQARMTTWSNAIPFALFDVLLVTTLAVLGVIGFRAIRRGRRGRSWHRVASGALAAVSVVATAYVWFALMWGLNYRRLSIDERLGADPGRVTSDAVLALGERAIVEVNRRYAPAHARGFPDVHDVPADLVGAFHETERMMGRPRPFVPGHPKRTLLDLFFRASGTDGMTAPFFLETLLNAGLTGPERPIVLAHEWAHLSGLAPEADASFIAVLAALRADVSSQYSAWLSLVMDVASRLPSAPRSQLTERLEEGPRGDWALIVARLQTRVRVVERVSWLTYDRYLRSQGVDEGVVNYSRVIELLIATDALSAID
ncbi:MAG: DUF3810 family protein [Vicinamibacterales bacterium]